ncbi:hypothetical protein MHUMG1_09667 [Metarhizium humberi]|uniref:Uncharacterized protein n=1 Tax=Metarhizium humberi TaxID=2596975 RepID=A0A9P8M4B1_9HYPO|nr:hypothetical protein MHUMG1_09667 [Metarhizium humberi]
MRKVPRPQDRVPRGQRHCIKAPVREADLGREPGTFRDPVTATHRLAYHGEPCSIALLGHESFLAQLGHSAATDSIPRSNGLEKLDRIGVETLIRKGALMLPPKPLCDDLVDSYFGRIHPVAPILNKACFVRQYRHHVNLPSLLLLQAVI